MPASAMRRGAKRCAMSWSTWRGTTSTKAPPSPPEHGAVRRYRDLASLTAYLQGLGALGNSVEALGAQPMR